MEKFKLEEKVKILEAAIDDLKKTKAEHHEHILKIEMEKINFEEKVKIMNKNYQSLLALKSKNARKVEKINKSQQDISVFLRQINNQWQKKWTKHNQLTAIDEIESLPRPIQKKRKRH